MSSGETIMNVDTSSQAEESESPVTDVIEDVVKLEVDEQQLKPAEYIYETEEESAEDPLDEDEAFDALPAQKKRVYNEMVKFQTAIREHRLSGSLRRIIHGQQENINPPMPTTVAQKEMATATVATEVIKTECISTLSGPIRRVTPILIKEEPSEVHIIQDTDAFKHELPSVPEHLFNQLKREVDDPANSYSEYETDDSQYLADDVNIVTETDSDDAEEFVDNTLTSYSIETLDAALMKIRDGLSIAAMGYEEIRQALPNINPIEVPQIIEQVPLP